MSDDGASVIGEYKEMPKEGKVVCEEKGCKSWNTCPILWRVL